MGFQVVVMFSDSFMDDVIYVRDAEVCMWSTIYPMFHNIRPNITFPPTVTV